MNQIIVTKINFSSDNDLDLDLSSKLFSVKSSASCLPLINAILHVPSFSFSFYLSVQSDRII